MARVGKGHRNWIFLLLWLSVASFAAIWFFAAVDCRLTSVEQKWAVNKSNLRPDDHPENGLSVEAARPGHASRSFAAQHHHLLTPDLPVKAIFQRFHALTRPAWTALNATIALKINVIPRDLPLLPTFLLSVELFWPPYLGECIAVLEQEHAWLQDYFPDQWKVYVVPHPRDVRRLGVENGWMLLQLWDLYADQFVQQTERRDYVAIIDVDSPLVAPVWPDAVFEGGKPVVIAAVAEAMWFWRDHIEQVFGEGTYTLNGVWHLPMILPTGVFRDMREFILHSHGFEESEARKLAESLFSKNDSSFVLDDNPLVDILFQKGIGRYLIFNDLYIYMMMEQPDLVSWHIETWYNITGDWPEHYVPPSHDWIKREWTVPKARVGHHMSYNWWYHRQTSEMPHKSETVGILVEMVPKLLQLAICAAAPSAFYRTASQITCAEFPFTHRQDADTHEGAVKFKHAVMKAQSLAEFADAIRYEMRVMLWTYMAHDRPMGWSKQGIFNEELTKLDAEFWSSIDEQISRSVSSLIKQRN